MNNRELVMSYLRSFATGDADVIAGHVSKDFENIQLGELGTGCKGRDRYRHRLESFLTEFLTLEYHVENVVVEGDCAAAAYTMTFTQDAREFRISGAMMFELGQGKITVRRDYWDGLSYQRQASN